MAQMAYKRRLCPAKVNATLRIGPRRPDGFHPLESLMLPLHWGDRLSVRLKPSRETKIGLRCKGARIPQKKNLVYRAAENFSERFKIPFHADIVLEKVVPTGAGLGGGSSDAAMMLKILQSWSYRSLRKKIPDSKLSILSASLGSDIPFFLLNGPAWCTGRGEKCRRVKLRRWPLVLVLPSISVPTPWAYRSLYRYRGPSWLGWPSRGLPLWTKRRNQKIPALETEFEAVILRLKPVLKKVKVALAQEGALANSMSGSGSAFFGIFKNFKEAKAAARRLRRRGFCAVATQTLEAIDKKTKAF